METIIDPKFSPGQVVATRGAYEALMRLEQDPTPFLIRHLSGDWGDIPPEDVAENERSLQHGYRLMSVYYLFDRTKIWVITEADRSSTTILLPEEY